MMIYAPSNGIRRKQLLTTTETTTNEHQLQIPINGRMGEWQPRKATANSRAS